MHENEWAELEADLAATARLLEQIRQRLAREKELLRRQASPVTIPTAPRRQQTLQRLLKGDSEKQIAQHLGISPHTVHIYVRNLYREFGVNSRGELMALFVNQPEPVEVSADRPKAL